MDLLDDELSWRDAVIDGTAIVANVTAMARSTPENPATNASGFRPWIGTCPDAETISYRAFGRGPSAAAYPAHPAGDAPEPILERRTDQMGNAQQIRTPGSAPITQVPGPSLTTHANTITTRKMRAPAGRPSASTVQNRVTDEGRAPTRAPARMMAPTPRPRPRCTVSPELSALRTGGPSSAEVRASLPYLPEAMCLDLDAAP